MPSIPVTSPLSYLGVFSLIAGVFFVLAGLDIITTEKITVASGKKAWIAGIVFVVLGIVLLIPDATATTQVNTPTPTSTLTLLPVTAEPLLETPQPSLYQREVTQEAVLEYIVLSSNTKIYEEPDENSRVIESIPVNQKVEAIEKNENWLLITYVEGNVRTTGWVLKENLRIIK